MDSELEFLAHMLELKGATDEEIDAFLEHSGVKGMKWGVRKEARREIAKTGTTAREIISQGKRAETPAARKAAADRYKKEVFDVIKDPAWKQTYKNATAMTKGDKAVHILLLGPLAALTIPAARKAAKSDDGYNYEVDSAHDVLRELRRP